MFGKTTPEIVGIVSVMVAMLGIAAPALASTSSTNTLSITDSNTVNQSNTQSNSQTANIASDNTATNTANNNNAPTQDASGGSGVTNGDQNSHQSVDQSQTVVNTQDQSSSQSAKNTNTNDPSITLGQFSSASDPSSSHSTNVAELSDKNSVTQGNTQSDPQQLWIGSNNQFGGGNTADNFNGPLQNVSGGCGVTNGDQNSHQSVDQSQTVVNTQDQSSSQHSSNTNTNDPYVDACQISDASDSSEYVWLEDLFCGAPS